MLIVQSNRRLNVDNSKSFDIDAKGPACHTIAYRRNTSACQRMKNITHTLENADIYVIRGTLGIGCIHFKHGRIR